MSIILASILIGLAAILLSVAVIVWRTLALVQQMELGPSPADQAKRSLLKQADELETSAKKLDARGSVTSARDRWDEARDIREDLL